MSLDAQGYIDWLAPGFVKLDSEWQDQSWDEMRSTFLDSVGASASELDSVLKQLLDYVDYELSSDSDRKQFLTSSSEREGKITSLVPEISDEELPADEQLADEYEQPADEPAADDDPFGWGWVTVEQASELSNIYGNTWYGNLRADLEYEWGSGWESNPSQHKSAWLVELLPRLPLPRQQLSREQILESVFLPAIAAVEDDLAADFAAEFEVEPADLAELLDDLPPEFYDQLMIEAATEAGLQLS